MILLPDSESEMDIMPDDDDDSDPLWNPTLGDSFTYATQQPVQLVDDLTEDFYMWKTQHVKKLHKIRPTYDELRENLKTIPPEERQSEDEQMILFQRRLNFKQYLKDKRHSWVVIVLTTVGVSRIVNDLEIYRVKGSVLASPSGLGADVV
ncbi:hypothetical protein QYM36_004342 [Artemia franciscana]|uniref:PiggyBac transposable element-derived protein domain-containing protein n=1 Tax=Artemia franciscana TaxID=6661 RepID=A0AA88I3D6_ARTSF|nr:hypothetical protein QYM36_004342 [Artemia franciscana]